MSENDNKSIQNINTNNDLTSQISTLDETSKNAIIKMAIEGKLKISEKIETDELKSKNATEDFDRHMQAIRRLDAREGRGTSTVNSQIETPSGHMSIQSHSAKCYVATATYENQFHPNVVILRDYRDRFLRKTFWGRTFIKVYYAIGKYLAFFPEHFNFIRQVSKWLLDKIVERILIKHYL